MTANSGQLDNLPFINEARVKSVLEWAPLIDVLENAMIEFSAGRVNQPVRQMVPVPGEDAIIAAMPAVGESMAVKIVTLFHNNPSRGLPSHQAVIVVFNKDNGTPLAVLDGRLITEMRTAAGSAAAARRLALAKPSVITVLGSGVQGRAHVEALRAVRDCEEWRIWSRNEAAGKALAQEVGATFVADVNEAVTGADIVACTTSAKEPLFDGTLIKPGAFVTSVGWNTADGRELDDAAMANTVIVESRDAANDQAGDVRVSGCEIFAEIGEVYAGNKVIPDNATVIFDSVGIAIMDVAAAQLVYELVSQGS